MPIPTFILLPEIFDAVIPITTVVVEPGATYTAVVVTPTFAFVFNLKVKDLWYTKVSARS